ncbi:twin-arginine translocase subunit TatC [Trebonia sp.]|uniref:twin-arginine translocase subunit TatC n=1 Tax=Trebonia sp. TaxID=2767075 RepID=UPI0026244A42|nr:twin-arginine translocase subunit TatC [Trebonia sp.]
MANKPGAVTGARIVGERYVRMKRRQNPEGRMPLMEHLRELRNRILKAAVVLLVGMIIALVFSNATLNIVAHPFCSAVINGRTGCQVVGDKLVASGIFDPFFLRIQVAFWFALVGTCPIWLYQLWAFIAPGLYAREKKWAYLFTLTAVPLFAGGAVLAYFVMDRGLHYLLGLAPQNTLVLPSWDTYLGYFTGMLVGFGIVFELPLVIVMLNIAGILTHERFRKWRRMMIFLIFLIAGIVNPSPDPWTMLMLGGIAVVLVEVAEIIVYFNDKRRARLHPSPYAGLSDDELSPLEATAPVDADSSLN